MPVITSTWHWQYCRRVPLEAETIYVILIVPSVVEIIANKIKCVFSSSISKMGAERPPRRHRPRDVLCLVWCPWWVHLGSPPVCSKIGCRRPTVACSSGWRTTTDWVQCFSRSYRSELCIATAFRQRFRHCLCALLLKG